MKVLVDTNIWLDLLLDRQPFSVMSHAALAACINDEDDICIAPTSLKDVFYLVRKKLDAKHAYEAIELILNMTEVLVIDRIICEKAIQLERPDYEDGMIAAIALTEKADCILTRDEGAFTELSIPKYSPTEFLKAQGYEKIDFD